MPSAWTLLRTAVNPLARRFGQYTAYTIGHDEYVGTLGKGFTVRDARHYLEQNAYEPQYLSAAKRLPGTGQLHDLSYRYVPTSHPHGATDTALTDWPPEACQFHVHVFVTDYGSEPLFFSHYELRPDFWSPGVSLKRLRTHYRPEYGHNYLRGVTNLDL